jgi:hypothetical protein
MGTLLSSTLDVRPAQEFTSPPERMENRLEIYGCCDKKKTPGQAEIMRDN